MTRSALLAQRLRSQQLAGPPGHSAADVVAWFGAVQAQDYPGARWAVGQRGEQLTDALVARAVDDGVILRTHVLRPTWHLVAPADIRWMLALTAPRIRQAVGYYLRGAGFDARLLVRSVAALSRALAGGVHLTRTELAAALAQAGIAARGADLANLLMHAELDALICSGAARGRQSTYALLDERVPPAPALERDAALAALAMRYFQSHGPATVADFGWWSGLTVSDARAGIALAGSGLISETISGVSYWLARSSPPGRVTPTAFLLPNYDEFLVAYKDRSAAVEPPPDAAAPSRAEIFTHVVVLDGRVAGTWLRTVRRGSVIVEARMRRAISAAEGQRLEAAAARLGRFLETRVTLTVLQ